MSNDFQRQLPLINQIVKLCQGWKSDRITMDEVARHLEVPLILIMNLFDDLGLAPRAWSAPEDYAIEDVIEASTRHEVSRRANP